MRFIQEMPKRRQEPKPAKERKLPQPGQYSSKDLEGTKKIRTGRGEY